MTGRPERTRAEIVAGMCSTWRHDFGLLGEDARGILRSRMDAVFEVAVAPAASVLDAYRAAVREKTARVEKAIPDVSGEKLDPADPAWELSLRWSKTMSISLSEDGVSYAIYGSETDGWISGRHLADREQENAGREIQGLLEDLHGGDVRAFRELPATPSRDATIDAMSAAWIDGAKGRSDGVRISMEQVFDHEIGPLLDAMRSEADADRIRLENAWEAVPYVTGEDGSELVFGWSRMLLTYDEDLCAAYAIRAWNDGTHLPGTFVVQDEAEAAANEIASVVASLRATGRTGFGQPKDGCFPVATGSAVHAP